MGRRYITLNQSSDDLTGLYSKLGNVEEPSSCQLSQRPSDMTRSLGSDQTGRAGQSPDSLKHLQDADDGTPSEEAVLMGMSADLQDQLQPQAQQAKQAQQAQQPQPEQQQSQLAAWQGQHQSSQQQRQPFKQLQSSQPQQWQQQLEMQHLSSEKARATLDMLSDQHFHREAPLHKQHQQIRQQAPQGFRSDGRPWNLPSSTQEADVGQLIGSRQHQQQDTDRQASLASSQQHQHQLQQQQQQECDVTSPFASTQHLHAATGSQQQTAKGWTLLFESLSPSRLWAFLALGIPGGLASSVESSAAEVTTALAGILGKPYQVSLPALRALPALLSGQI